MLFNVLLIDQGEEVMTEDVDISEAISQTQGRLDDDEMEIDT